MPTHVEMRHSVPLVQSRHDWPSCRPRNANAFQAHTVIEDRKLDPNLGLVHLKVDGGVTNEDFPIEVLQP